MNKNSVIEWCKKLRSLCCKYLDEENMMLGGVDKDNRPIEVEIDESLFFKRKFNCGRLGRGAWVFGTIERVSGKCFFVPVERRDSATLLGIINERIRPGTRIILDEWVAYRGIARTENFLHTTVIYSINFVSPNDSTIHNYNIEIHWSCVKRKLQINLEHRKSILKVI